MVQVCLAFRECSGSLMGVGVLVALFFALTAFPLPARAADTSYVIGDGDQIRISVFGEEDLSLTVRVSGNGKISYPFLGELAVSGLTPQGVERLVADGLRGDYLIDPKVTVSIEEYRSVFVNGAVNQPKGIEFVPGLTVRKVISMAGGFTERASREKVFLIQEDDPQRRPMRVSLDAPVRPGDIVTVEESFF